MLDIDFVTHQVVMISSHYLTHKVLNWALEPACQRDTGSCCPTGLLMTLLVKSLVPIISLEARKSPRINDSVRCCDTALDIMSSTGALAISGGNSDSDSNSSPNYSQGVTNSPNANTNIRGRAHAGSSDIYRPSGIACVSVCAHVCAHAFPPGLRLHVCVCVCVRTRGDSLGGA